MNLTYHVHKPAGFVFEYLTDMQKFVSVHPVVHQMDPLGGNRFLVHETLKAGFIPYSFTYPVTIDSNAEQNTVTMKATVMKLVDIEMHFTVEADGPFSIVKEEIIFRSFLPVKAIMGSIFKQQHKLLFQKIGLAIADV